MSVINYEKLIVGANGAKFEAFMQQLFGIHSTYYDFRNSWFCNVDRVEVMNRASKKFFNKYRRTSLYMVCLDLTNITDRPRSSGQQILTIKNLLRSIDDDNFTSRIEVSLKRLQPKMKDIKALRDTLISHNNLSVKLGYEDKPAPWSFDIEFAFLEVLNIAEELHKHLVPEVDCGSIFSILRKPPSTNGFETVMSLIEKGLED